MQFYRCILGAFLALPLFAQPDPSLHVGFYHWGGAYPTSISEGVEAIAAIGGHVARLAVSARMNDDYGMGESCIPDFTLAGAMQDPDMKKALDHPAISVFMLTAYDGVTFGDCVTHEYLNPRLNMSRQAAIIQEYSDLALYLYQTYELTNKQFILLNWESDHDVYCSNALAYSTDNIWRADCDANYPQQYNGNASPTDSFWGLRLWFEARQKGIEDGRNRALAMGVGGRGRKVYLAPEVNTCRRLRSLGLKSTLYDVVPYVKFDYVSYSSWESMGVFDPRNALLEDLETIRSVTGSNNIIIGELRTAYSSADPQGSIQTLREVMDGALSWGVPYIIYWDVYDLPKDCPNCGLYDADGRITLIGEFFKDYLDPPAPSTRPRHLRARGARP